LYAPHCAISNCRLVTLVPMSFIVDQLSGRCFIICIYCSSVQVARSSVKREIVWGCEPGAHVAGDGRLRPFGGLPLVVGACVRFVCCRWPEQLPMALMIFGSSSVLNVFFIICNSSALLCCGEDAFGSCSGPCGQGLFGIRYLAFLHH